MNAGNMGGRFGDLPPEELKILRARAVEAARAPSVIASGGLEEILEVKSLDQTFAIPLKAVDGVAELSSIAVVPRPHSFVRGLVSFRGEVLLGVELSTLVGGPRQGIADLRRVVAVSAAGRRMAVLAEKVMAVRTVELSAFRTDPMMWTPFVTGTDGEFTSLLEPGALIEFAMRSMEGGAR